MNRVNRMVQVFLRRTDGKGERILVNPELPIRLFHVNVCTLLGVEELEIFLRGEQIEKQCDGKMEDLQIKSGEIFHLKLAQNAAQLNDDDHIEVQVFYQGSIYSYKSNQAKSTIFLHIYEDITNRENKSHIPHQQSTTDPFIPMIVYLGKQVNLTDLISTHGLRNGDMVTLHKVPKLMNDQTNLTYLPQKCITVGTVKVQSITLATSETKNCLKNNKNLLQSKEILRKSSMKSSHQSRQFDRKFLHEIKLGESRSLSEDINVNKKQEKQQREEEENSQKRCQDLQKIIGFQETQKSAKYEKRQLCFEVDEIEGEEKVGAIFKENVKAANDDKKQNEPAFEGLDLFKHSWLTNKEVISTYSINCDEEDQNEVMLWLDCKISFQNEEKTHFFTFDCKQKNTFEQIYTHLIKIEKKFKHLQRDIHLVFTCENAEIMQKIDEKEKWDNLQILNLARDLQMQQLPTITYKFG